MLFIGRLYIICYCKMFFRNPVTRSAYHEAPSQDQRSILTDAHRLLLRPFNFFCYTEVI